MKMKNSLLLMLCIGIFSATAQTKKPVAKTTPAPKKTTTATKPDAPTNDQGIFADIETSKGKITVQLEYKKTPITVANFISLAEGTNTFVTDPNLKGKPFYNGLKF